MIPDYLEGPFWFNDKANRLRCQDVYQKEKSSRVLCDPGNVLINIVTSHPLHHSPDDEDNAGGAVESEVSSELDPSEVTGAL